MTQRIIFPMSDGKIALISPVSGSEFTIEQIAQKDVPAGVPYLIVAEADLPPLETQEAWEADFSQPHGHGMGHDAWVAANQGGGN